MVKMSILPLLQKLLAKLAVQKIMKIKRMVIMMRMAIIIMTFDKSEVWWYQST